MENIIKASVLFALITYGFGLAYADQTAAVTYSATLYSKMTPLISTQPNFGIISIDTSLSNTATVVLANTGNTVTSSSPGISIDSGGTSGVLQITGQTGKTVSISISPSITMSGTGGATGITVTPSLAATSITLTSGSAVVGFGGTLNLPALNTTNLTGLTYSGNGTMTVHY